jgi:hypothetical protein
MDTIVERDGRPLPRQAGREVGSLPVGRQVGRKDFQYQQFLMFFKGPLLIPFGIPTQVFFQIHRVSLKL